MICPDCDREITGDRCLCGYEKYAGSTGDGVPWLIHHCATPGCNTAIRTRFNQPLSNPLCKWCQEKAREDQEEYESDSEGAQASA